jgi:hypothetical protein
MIEIEQKIDNLIDRKVKGSNYKEYKRKPIDRDGFEYKITKESIKLSFKH